MKTRVIFAVSAAVILLSCASHGAALPKGVQDEKAEALAAVSPAVIRSLKASVPRKQLIAALLANAKMKPVIQKEASRHGIASSQIGALATKPFPRTLSGEIVTMAAQMKADEAAFAAIDWSAGINMTPAGIPTYGSGKWKVAMLMVRDATFMTSQPDSLTISTEGNPYMSQIIHCDMELPVEPGLYAITIRLARKDGYVDPAWPTHEKDGQNPIQASWHDISAQHTWMGGPIDLVTVPEVKGFVALAHANPVGFTEFENTGMRKVTSRFTLSFYPFAQLTTSPLGDQVFAGITVTRL